MAKVIFTGAKVSKFKCPSEKGQAFMWDSTTKGLGLRATPSGKPSYVFQALYQGKDVRLTIGSPDSWALPQAQEKARELQRNIDEGKDPRDLKRDALAAQVQSDALNKAGNLTVQEVWTVYIEQRRSYWGPLHYQDHINKTKTGGLPSAKRGDKRLTTAGPLATFMPLPLKDLDQATIEAWAVKEGRLRPTSARLAWRLLTVFQKGQLKDWFAATQQIHNPTISAALQVLLLTGARLNEVLTIRWEDVNIQWKGVTINDKVEGAREIPLTPYVEHLITSLPRRNGYVFASARSLDMSPHNIARRKRKANARGQQASVGSMVETSVKGHISVPNTSHTRACRTVGLGGLTLHGLRRSFKSLTEWLEVPVGVVAQIQGHKPSATAEKHYTVRPLELLRVHHEKIERWILEQACIEFDAKATPGKLHVVA